MDLRNGTRPMKPMRKKSNSNRALFILLLIAFALALTACGKGSPEGETTTAAPAETTAATEESTAADRDKPLATVVFASDLQKEEGWGEPADNLAAILRAIQADGKSPDGVVICGDYTNDRHLHDYQISPEDTIAQARKVIHENCPDVDEGAALFNQGNHDKLTESIAETGLHDCGEYLVYVLNTENDFPWKQGKERGCLDKVRQASEVMKACFDQLIGKGEKRPVFIAGHVPLHYTARTSSRHTTGDNLYSSILYNVVNEAAKDLNIVFLFGHNHSKGWDCYLGGSSVYKGVGDKILIPQFSENDRTTDRFTEETLNFTYLNAGYAGFYMNCGPEELEAGDLDKYRAADETLTATVCEIWPDRMDLTRYSADGVHPLGWAGEADPYKGGIDKGLIGEEYYSQKTESPQTIALSR